MPGTGHYPGHFVTHAAASKVSPFVFTPARNIIKLNSQGSDPLKLTPPPVQKLDDNYEKLYMTPNLPLQSLQSQKPEQSLLPHAQRQPSHNLIQPAPENHISIHQSGSISQTSFVNQYALNFQPQSEVREDFPQRLIPKFQLPLNSLPLPVNSTPIRIPPPVLESFTVVESSTNSTTESLSVVANRLELMEKGNDR
ncbi:hypothetical protein HK098_002854 [Nowakowskiella sp. JEL0407]|nr:hypothetical protein HK098_002854 [Nowakowskiella sp. JEL0407]